MRRSRLCGIFAAVLLLSAVSVAAKAPEGPFKFFREFVGLNEEPIDAIRSGQAIAKVMNPPQFVPGGARQRGPDRDHHPDLCRATSDPGRHPVTSSEICRKELEVMQEHL